MHSTAVLPNFFRKHLEEIMIHALSNYLVHDKLIDFLIHLQLILLPLLDDVTMLLCAQTENGVQV